MIKEATCNSAKFPDMSTIYPEGPEVQNCVYMYSNSQLLKVSPVEVAEAYSEISLQYEYMEELDSASLLLKRSLAVLEKVPEEGHSEGRVSAKLGLLLLQKGVAVSALSYFNRAADKLQESLGYQDHFSVAYIFNYMAVASSKLGDPVHDGMFDVARHYLEATLGVCHADSIAVRHYINKLDDRTKSYQRVVDALEGRGADAMTHRKLLEQRAIENLCKNCSSDNDDALLEQ